MNATEEFQTACQCTSISPATVDFFSINFDAWLFGVNPASNMTIRGVAYIGARNSGGFYQSLIIWFTFQRYLGVITATVDQSFGSAGTLAGAVSSHTAKLQFTAPSNTIDYHGVVRWGAHY